MNESHLKRLARRREARGGLSIKAALRGWGNLDVQQIKLDGRDKKTQLHRMANGKTR